MIQLNEKKLQIICVLIAIIGFSLVAFYLGRKTISYNSHTEVVYVKGEKITDSIPYPKPVEVFKPVDTANVIKQCVKDGIYTELFPNKTEIEYIVITQEDTSAIIIDWGTKRLYSETLFDIDTIGKCTVDATIQYNRLSLLAYDYIPVHKTVTIQNYKIKAFSPFIGGGLLLEDNEEKLQAIPVVNLGFFIKEKYGINLQFGKNLDNKNNLYGGSFFYKF